MGPSFSKDQAEKILKEIAEVLERNGIKRPIAGPYGLGKRMVEDYDKGLEDLRKVVVELVWNDDCANF